MDLWKRVIFNCLKFWNVWFLQILQDKYHNEIFAKTYLFVIFRTRKTAIEKNLEANVFFVGTRTSTVVNTFHSLDTQLLKSLLFLKDKCSKISIIFYRLLRSYFYPKNMFPVFHNHGGITSMIYCSTQLTTRIIEWRKNSLNRIMDFNFSWFQFAFKTNTQTSMRS